MPTLRGAVAALALCLPAPTVAQENPPLAATAGEEVLLQSLLGIDLVRRADASLPGPGVQIGDLDLPAAAALQGALTAAIGAPASFESLGRVADAIRAHLEAEGYRFTLVSLPEQDITDGEVRYLIQPATLQLPVLVDGGGVFDPQIWRDAVVVRADGTLDEPLLTSRLGRLNANPFREARVVAEPGIEPGTTRLTLEVEEQRPLSFRASYAYRSEQSDQATFGVTWGDAFGLGDLLTYDLSAEPGNDRSANHALSYTRFLGPERQVTARLSYSNPLSRFSGVFDQETRTRSWAVELADGLDDTAGWSGIGWRIGVEGTREESVLRFGGTPVNTTDTDILQLTAALSARRPAGDGVLSARTRLRLSPGGLTDRNDDAAFGAIRTGAAANYAVLTGDLDWSGPLADRRLVVEGHLQLATGPLLPSQQFSAFSADGIRLGPDRLTGDHGLAVRTALDLLPAEASPDWINGYAFADLALARISGAGPGVDALRSAWGLGLGAAVRLGDRAVLDILAGRFERETNTGRFGDTALDMRLNFTF